MPTRAPNGDRTASSAGSLVSKTSLLRELHQGPKVLVLPNAWDVASARIFETAGFPAIATTSAGVANSLGYPDVERISRDEMLDVVGRIVKAVSAPVTADVEAGYGDALKTAQALADIGACGMNLEDTTGLASLIDIPAQVKIIQAIRSKTEVVINARTDVWMFSIGDPATLLERTIERIRAYRDAGADCVFVPGVRDAQTIAKLVQAAKCPINILATAGTPPIAELQHLGVARVSIGSGAMRATMGLTQRIAQELFERGTYSSFTEGAMPYPDANRLFK